MTRRRKPPYRAAGAWLWVDTYLKLPVSAKIAVLGLVMLVGAIVAAYWWIILTVLAVLAAWRYWLNAGGPNDPRKKGNDRIPYGKLSMIEWACCRVIGFCEMVLRRHNMRRRNP